MLFFAPGYVCKSVKSDFFLPTSREPETKYEERVPHLEIPIHKYYTQGVLPNIFKWYHSEMGYFIKRKKKRIQWKKWYCEISETITLVCWFWHDQDQNNKTVLLRERALFNIRYFNLTLPQIKEPTWIQGSTFCH